jgi:hypothetical protein
MKKNGNAGGRRTPLSGDELVNFGDQPNQFDEELGRQMARDARRVSDGELSEAAFHEKYHEAVVEEFGRDDRPLDVD